LIKRNCYHLHEQLCRTYVRIFAISHKDYVQGTEKSYQEKNN